MIQLFQQKQKLLNLSTDYTFDRKFTNFIHNLALRKIYQNLKWEVAHTDSSYLEDVDRNIGIDYFFNDADGKKISVQERFRENKYSRYNDFTIRYRRDFSRDPDRKLSEFFKMKADFFVYGISNGSKFNHESNSDFIKYAVIDLEKFRKNIDNQKIVIKDSNSYSSQIINGVMYAPIKQNRDYSSNFVVFDIRHLDKIDKKIILIQKGFI